MGMKMGKINIPKLTELQIKCLKGFKNIGTSYMNWAINHSYTDPNDYDIQHIQAKSYYELLVHLESINMLNTGVTECVWYWRKLKWWQGSSYSFKPSCPEFSKNILDHNYESPTRNDKYCKHCGKLIKFVESKYRDFKNEGYIEDIKK